MAQVTYLQGIDGSEAAMRQAGIDRYLKRQDKLSQRGSAAERDDYAKIIRDNLLKFSDSLEATIAKDESQRGRNSQVVAYIKELDTVTTAYITLSSILANIAFVSDRYKMQTRIGLLVEQELRFQAVSKANPELLTRLLRFAKQRGSVRHRANFVMNTAAKEGIVPSHLTMKERTLIGAKLLNVAEDVGLVTSETVKQRGVSATTVSLSENVVAWLADHRSKAEDGTIPMASPVFAPMTQTPRDWSGRYTGGYEFIQSGLIKPKHAYADYENADMSKVFRAVNIMQRTAWRINPVMLAVVEAFWSQGVRVGKLPVATPQPVPERLSDAEWTALAEDEKKALRVKLGALHADNREAGTQLASISMVLNQAKELQYEPAIYLPYQLDYRGRAYCAPLLNPQGPDYIRSLFEFANGKPVGDRGETWIALQAASLWDGPERLSKCSFQERQDWVDANEWRIRSVVEEPISDTWWHQADKPFMFLRTCMALVGCWDNGPEYVARVPIALDGSCSGIQHYAAQLRNRDCARSVNLTPSAQPADIYTEVAEAVLASVKSDRTSLIHTASTTTEDINPCEFWLAHGITRKVVKTPVMTYGYSSREAGFTEKYEFVFVRPALKEMGRTDKANPIARYLAKKTLAAVEDRLAPVKEGMDWLMKCADLLAHEGKGVTWTAPSGFPIVQKYMDYPSIRVQTWLEGEKLRISIPGEPTKINIAKQKAAISPNFVHSMDAAHLMLTVLEAHDTHGITDFALIHDSFGTLPADADGMFVSVRDAFVDMYTQTDPFWDLFESVKADLSEKGRAKLPEPPAMGDLDLEEVRQSLYAFA